MIMTLRNRSTILDSTRFGKLTTTGAFKSVPVKGGTRRYYECRCDCGKLCWVDTHSLRYQTRSCGCLQRERASQANFRHGLSRTPTHNVWMTMLARCQNPRSDSWENYGGRGIRVCKRWLKFENFLADMGVRPPGDYSIERRDNSGSYCKSNCYWATRFQQAANRRGNWQLKLGVETVNAAEAARRIGIRGKTLRSRLAKGWTHERALSTPIRRKRVADAVTSEEDSEA